MSAHSLIVSPEMMRDFRTAARDWPDVREAAEARRDANISPAIIIFWITTFAVFNYFQKFEAETGNFSTPNGITVLQLTVWQQSKGKKKPTVRFQI